MNRKSPSQSKNLNDTHDNVTIMTRHSSLTYLSYTKAGHMHARNEATRCRYHHPSKGKRRMTEEQIQKGIPHRAEDALDSGRNRCYELLEIDFLSVDDIESVLRSLHRMSL